MVERLDVRRFKVGLVVGTMRARSPYLFSTKINKNKQTERQTKHWFHLVPMKPIKLRVSLVGLHRARALQTGIDRHRYAVAGF